MARSQLLVLLVVCGLAAASAFPYLFVNEDAETCTSHPNKAGAGHGAPVLDRTPVYALRDSKNALARFACPGGKYQLTITFPEPRNALVTTTVGTLAGGTLNTKGTCMNRALTIRGPGKGGRVATMTLPWSVPCNAKGKAAVVVTSARGSRDSFRRATTEVMIGARPACPALC